MVAGSDGGISSTAEEPSVEHEVRRELVELREALAHEGHERAAVSERLAVESSAVLQRHIALMQSMNVVESSLLRLETVDQLSDRVRALESALASESAPAGDFSVLEERLTSFERRLVSETASRLYLDGKLDEVNIQLEASKRRIGELEVEVGRPLTCRREDVNSWSSAASTDVPVSVGRDWTARESPEGLQNQMCDWTPCSNSEGSLEGLQLQPCNFASCRAALNELAVTVDARLQELESLCGLGRTFDGASGKHIYGRPNEVMAVQVGSPPAQLLGTRAPSPDSQSPELASMQGDSSNVTAYSVHRLKSASMIGAAVAKTTVRRESHGLKPATVGGSVGASAKAPDDVRRSVTGQVRYNVTGKYGEQRQFCGSASPRQQAP